MRMQKIRTLGRLFGILVLTALSFSTGRAQGKDKIKQLTPTQKGSTGLFNVYLADTLRKNEFTLGFHTSRIHREPGEINITVFPLSFSLGLHDRLEIFFSWEPYKRVRAAYLTMPFGEGPGDLWAGAKINLLSERRGAPFGLALQPAARFPTSDSPANLARGLTSGGTDASLDLIFSKNLAGGGTLAVNAGVIFADDKPNMLPAGTQQLDRQSSFNWALGLELPLGQSKTRLVGEVLGSAFFGSQTAHANPTWPVDLYAGLRFFPTRRITFSTGYSFNLRTIDQDLYAFPATGRHGWFVQLLIQRKVNYPPSLECRAENSSISQEESVTIQARVLDPDDDMLAITWKSSGGRIMQQTSSALFDSTGLSPGKYTITAEVSDGENSAVCTVEVTVNQRTIAPAVIRGPAQDTI